MAAPDYKSFISMKHGACADAFHDFAKKGFNKVREPTKNPGLPEVLLGIFDAGRQDINGIPGQAVNTKLRSEAGMLQELFSEFGLDNAIKPVGTAQDTIMKNIIDALYSQTDPAKKQNFYEHNFNLKTINNVVNYKVQLLSKETRAG